MTFEFLSNAFQFHIILYVEENPTSLEYTIRKNYFESSLTSETWDTWQILHYKKLKTETC